MSSFVSFCVFAVSQYYHLDNPRGCLNAAIKHFFKKCGHASVFLQEAGSSGLHIRGRNHAPLGESASPVPAREAPPPGAGAQGADGFPRCGDVWGRGSADKQFTQVLV